jgi:hypothetical protein
MIDDGRHAIVGCDFQEALLELISAADVAGDDLVWNPTLFEKNRHLLAVRCRPIVHVDHC